MSETVLRTERLIGRPVEEADTALAARIWGEPDTAFWLAPDTRPFSREIIEGVTARLAAHWATHGFGLYMLFEADGLDAPLREDRYVGWCGVLMSVIDGRAMAEMGWATVSPAQGRGFATEAAREVLGQARRRGFREMAAYTRPSNLASRRVMAKLGFRETESFEYAGHPQLLHELRPL